MFTKKYVMGIDAGTEGLRAGLFDLCGKPVIYASENYNTYYGNHGEVSQDPGEWDMALRKAVRNAVENSGVNPAEIAGVGVDATIGTLVFMDNELNHISNAILWMDVRAADQFDRLKSLNHPALKLNPTAEWPLPKIMWVRENTPEVYERTRVILEFTNWLMYKMTGNVTGCMSNAVSRWFYNRRKGGYPSDLFEATGLKDLEQKLPEKTRFVGEVAGYVSKDFSRDTGLQKGIPVAVGCPDGISAMLGLNTFKPGNTLMICGTSHVHLAASDKEIHAKGIMGSYPDAVLPEIHFLEGGQVTTGAVLKWYRDNFLHKYYHEAAQKDMDVYGYLDALASDIQPGSEGLVVLEYFQGNRTPYQDPYARGTIWGISLKHTPVHIYRAIMEGVAYGTRHVFEAIKSEGTHIERVVACGGMTKSSIWPKIHADVCRLPVVITEVQEASVLGAAVVAAKAAGAYETLEEAADRMVREKEVIYPDLKTSSKYDFYYDLYKRTYPELKCLMKEMAKGK